jgi:hypothetical protein
MEEIGVGYDVWGFRLGELAENVLALVPEGPTTITAADIGSRLHTRVEVDQTAFVKTIRLKLIDLQRRNIVRSVRLGGHQLGWHLVS